MESFATPYPVLFYDGEQEHDKGHVGLHSVLTFKRFQALVAQKTGIPANQLSAVFVCRRTLKDTEKRQKLPINENTNFNIILNQHNPSRERDCHFLVSMKKSKKERKGGSTRKRSAEAENADDDDSTSSRGDLSPSDERPKVGSADDTFSPEATSPRSFHEGPPSPPAIKTTPSSNGNGSLQKTSSNGSPSSNGKLPLGEYRVERTLLRREGAGQNGFASPRSSFGGVVGATGQRVEGFHVTSSPAAAKGEIHTTGQTANGWSTLQLEDRRKLDKHWRKSTPGLDDSGTTLRQNEKATTNGHNAAAAASGQPSSGLHHSSSTRSDLFSPDRFNDSISQAHGMRSPSAVMVARGNGVQVGSSSSASAGLQRNSSSMISFQNGATRPTTPSISSAAATAAAGAFIPRVSMSSGVAAVAGNTATTGGLTLQQAQAHISHLQQLHQSSLTGAMSQIELSKLNGMIRGLVARDNSRGENPKICKLCCILREKNSGPPPFHWCVDDTITKGFRGPSPAGPIGRPVKWHVEAAA